MNTKQIAILFLMGVLVVGVVAASITSARAQTHSLVGAPMTDLADTAIEYTQTRFQVLSKHVAVPLVRPVTKQELPLLGLPEIDFGGEDPPLALVVLKGEFDVQNLRRSVADDTPWRVKFIAYVFDLKAGVPTLTVASPDGSILRDLLNDPSLPVMEPAINQAGTLEDGVEAPVPVAPVRRLPYGAMEPPVATPSDVLPNEP